MAGPGVQAGRAAAAPRRARRRRPDRARGVRRSEAGADDGGARRRSTPRSPAIPARRFRCRARPTARATWCSPASGFGAARRRAGGPPAQVVVIVAAGLYDDELFADGATVGGRGAAARARGARHALRGLLDAQPRLAGHRVPAPHRRLPGRAVRARGRGRSGPDLRAGRRPARDAAARGLRRQPGRLCRPGTRRCRSRATACSTPRRRLGLTTAAVGDVDLSHIGSAVDLSIPAAARLRRRSGGPVAALAADHPRLLAVVALGGPRTADRHDAKAVAELGDAGPADRRHRRAPPRRARRRHQPRRDAHRRRRSPTSTAPAHRATRRSSSSGPACAPASSPASRPPPPISPRPSFTRSARRPRPTSPSAPGRRAPPSAASRSRPRAPPPRATPFCAPSAQTVRDTNAGVASGRSSWLCSDGAQGLCRARSSFVLRRAPVSVPKVMPTFEAEGGTHERRSRQDGRCFKRIPSGRDLRGRDVPAGDREARR